MAFLTVVQLLFWFIAPGAFLAYLVRLPKLGVIAAAVPLSLAQLGFVALLSTFFHGIYRPFFILLCLLPIWVLGYVLGRWIARDNSSSTMSALALLSDLFFRPTRLVTTFLAMLFAGWTISSTLYRALEPIALAPAFWDIQFHNNVTRHLAESGNASPLNIHSFSMNLPLKISGYYPDGLHLVASLLGPSQVMMSVNLTQIVAVFLFGVGMVLLAFLLFPDTAAAPWLMALCVPLFTGFSAVIQTTAGKWAFGFGLALVPWVIATLVALWLWLNEGDSLAKHVTSVLVLLAATMSLAISHVGVLYVLAFTLVPAGISLVWQARYERTKKVVAIFSALYFFAIWGALLMLGRTFTSSINYPKYSRGREAIWEILSGSEFVKRYFVEADLANTWSVFILTVLAIVVVAFVGPRWILASYAIVFSFAFATLFLHVPYMFLLQPIYNDPVRAAALTSIFGPLLIVAGLRGLGVLATRFFPQNTLVVKSQSSHFAPFLAVAVFAGFVLGLNPDLRAHERYVIVNIESRKAGETLVDPEEFAMWQSFAHKYPQAGVLGDPTTGVPLMYAATGVKALPRFTSFVLNDREIQLLHEIGQNPVAPQTCDLAKQLGIQFVYDDDHKYMGGKIKQIENFDGLKHMLETKDGISLVAHTETARIYHLDKCFGPLKK
ncbi:hypothetical protein BK816_06235 [Boudabousia tangfeifanii]|uniref:Uncharacterized protein n=1 Tax=Boudabousia tangfeifanii TaxID=1912795 RepID=A0A1D9ML23_9ACTO|nr:DUF6541 family protein [Boudabousia tangfeifanii]AOZ72938.1 hypothetical protein BK816_06235 [Boudabousia tangfeifanii]